MAGTNRKGKPELKNENHGGLKCFDPDHRQPSRVPNKAEKCFDTLSIIGTFNDSNLLPFVQRVEGLRSPWRLSWINYRRTDFDISCALSRKWTRSSRSISK